MNFLARKRTAIAEKVLIEIRQRIKFLNDGCRAADYSHTGSAWPQPLYPVAKPQRVSNSATCLGSRLVGALLCSG